VGRRAAATGTVQGVCAGDLRRPNPASQRVLDPLGRAVDLRAVSLPEAAPIAADVRPTRRRPWRWPATAPPRRGSSSEFASGTRPRLKKGGARWAAVSLVGAMTPSFSPRSPLSLGRRRFEITDEEPLGPPPPDAPEAPDDPEPQLDDFDPEPYSDERVPSGNSPGGATLQARRPAPGRSSARPKASQRRRARPGRPRPRHRASRPAVGVPSRR
jgi:hypothetical protein